MTRPLEGLLVVSLEQAVAAPMTSRRLADAGARVIKVERPEGDFARGYDDAVHGDSSYFVWLNRGKQSVALDLRNTSDQALFAAMLARADVFIQNLKPGALDRLGFATETLRSRNPKLITCSLSGYGDSGPYVSRKAYDLLIQAESGLASVTGDPPAPSRVGISIVDVATGMTAYEAILEALILRGRTGQGSNISISMFDCMAELMSVPLLHGRYAAPPARVGLRHPSVAPYGVFSLADGSPILIAIQNEREWAVFARDVLDDPSLARDPQFATNVARVNNRAQTDARVAESLKRFSPDEAITVLDRADIAFGLVNDVSAVLKHPCFKTFSVHTPSGETAEVPVMAARNSHWSIRERGRVPVIGSHTDEIRQEFSSSRDG